MLVPGVGTMLATAGWARNVLERLVHPENVLGDPLLLVLDCSLRPVLLLLVLAHGGRWPRLSGLSSD